MSYRHHLSTIRNNAPLVASENIEKPVFQTTHKLEIPTWVKVIVIVGILIYAYQAGWLSQIATKATDFLETIEVPVGVQKIIEGTPLSPERKDQCVAAFEYLNQLREQEGRQPLIWDDRIYNLAVFRSRDMIERGYFDHVTPEGKCAEDFKEIFNINEYGTFAENIGGTTVTSINGIPSYYAPVTEAIDNWMNSRGHRYALLFPYPSDEKAAIGCYKHYCTFLVLTNEPFQCVHGNEGLAFWQTAPKQPGEL